MLFYLPTRVKIAGARLIYRILRRFISSDRVQVNRDGIVYELDLAEGIDLSLFVCGSFQPHIVANPLLTVKDGSCILDVGANIGSMSLAFAKRFPAARIIAFEPTDYAGAKFRRNLELNPSLAARITLVQLFLSAVPSAEPGIAAYASWRVAGVGESGRHPVHGGAIMPAVGVPATTIDRFCAEQALPEVGLIKIDTDGHEPAVLSGAREVIARYRPYVVFEVGGYVLAEAGLSFDWYLEYFSEFGYKLYNSSNNRALTPATWKKLIPACGTIDVLAIP